ncbi:MAG: hypothetical protein ABUL47_00170, partial [Leifsonia sp.]
PLHGHLHIDVINVDAQMIHAHAHTMQNDRMNDTLIDVPRGLTNVVAAETALGDVRGHEGFYHYRQYSAVELASERSFEEA